MRRARSPELQERAEHDLQLALQCLRIANREGITRKGYAALRKRVYNGERRLDKAVHRDVVLGQLAAIDAIRAEDLPPTRIMLRLVLEAMCMRHRAITEPKAWAMIGISEVRGRNILWGEFSPITWPEWSLLWDGSVGPAHHSPKPDRWSPKKDFAKVKVG